MTRARITVLGCGGSGGVPLAGGFWGQCDPANPKNRRRRASIAVQTNTTTIVIDTGPDFREQTISAGIARVDGILYTHTHSDHAHGIDDLRYLSIIQKEKIPVYADAQTMAELERRFDHMFVDDAEGLYPSCLTPTIMDTYGTYTIGDITFSSFYQVHGVKEGGMSLGFRLGNFAYSTDVTALPPESIDVLRGIDTWIVDGGMFGQEKITQHPNFPVVQGWNEQVHARRAILTHLTTRIDHDAMQSALPSGYEPAYDGLSFDIHL